MSSTVLSEWVLGVASWASCPVNLDVFWLAVGVYMVHQNCSERDAWEIVRHSLCCCCVTCYIYSFSSWCGLALHWWSFFFLPNIWASLSELLILGSNASWVPSTWAVYPISRHLCAINDYQMLSVFWRMSTRLIDQSSQKWKHMTRPLFSQRLLSNIPLFSPFFFCCCFYKVQTFAC